MITIAIDQSFTGTGMAVFHGENLKSRFQFTSNKDDPMLVRQRFLEQMICKVIVKVLEQSNGEEVHCVSEGLAYGGVGKSKIDLSKLLGGIQTRIADLIPMERIHEVSPTSWKKVLTGSGKADKKMVIATVNQKYGLELIGKHNNIADAIGIGIYYIQTKKTINDNKVGNQKLPVTQG